MGLLQGQVQPELLCPLSCGKLGASKAKIDHLPEKYIGAIRAARPSLSARHGTKWFGMERAMYNAARLGILNENRSSLLRGVIRHFVFDDFSTLHYEFDPLKFGDIG
jgi:hypothetical protein